MAANNVMMHFHSRLELPSASCSECSSSFSPSSGVRNTIFSPGTRGRARSSDAGNCYASYVNPAPCWRSARTSWQGSCCLRTGAVSEATVGNAKDSSFGYARVQERQTLTLYDILGVSSEASESDLKMAFRCMAKKYHPDRAPPEAASEYHKKFLELRRAYEVLKDHRTRALYDFEIRNSSKFWSQKFDAKHGQWHGYNWETDQCWTS